MKKIIVLAFAFLLTTYYSFGQYFQGSFTNSGSVISFKMKPTATLTTQISYLEVAFRYITATTPSFTVGAAVNNSANFTSTLSMQRLADYSDGTYTYVKFVHNTGVIASKTYTAGTEYEIFTVSLSGSPATANLEMASDLSDGNYVFGVVDGSATFLDPGAGDQLYGSGFYKSGNGQFVPLNGVTLPVKFLDFSVVKKDRDAVISWSVENEDDNADKYIVERSVNGNDFKPVETVAALNNGRTNNTYSVTQKDIASIAANAGQIYYKVKQIDKGGKFVYTATKNIRLDGKAFGVKANPNLFKSATTLTVDLEKDARVLVNVTDANGKQIKTLQFQGFKGTNIKELNLSGLAAGSYVLKVNAGEQIKTIPIVKAN